MGAGEVELHQTERPGVKRVMNATAQGPSWGKGKEGGWTLKTEGIMDSGAWGAQELWHLSPSSSELEGRLGGRVWHVT